MIQYRLADANDLENCHTLIDLLWPDYSARFAKEFAFYLSHRDFFAPHIVLGLDQQDRVVGIALLASSLMSFDLDELIWVGVHPDFERRGIGRHLVFLCLEESTRRGKATLLATETPAFYRAIGMKEIDCFETDKRYLFRWPAN